MLPLYSINNRKPYEPEEVPPNKPVPAAGCPVLAAAPVPAPNAVHSTDHPHFRHHNVTSDYSTTAA